MHGISRRIFLAVAASAAFGAGLAGTVAAAEAWPNHTMKIVVPFAPGGGGDVLGRLIADELAHTLGQAVVVDNKPGASTIIANDMVAKSQPDGHTILLNVPLLIQVPSLFSKLPYDTRKDLLPVIDVVKSPQWLAVNAERMPAKNLTEFMAKVGAEPGKHNFASIGNGSSGHLLGTQLLEAAKVEMVHVPYKGSAPALTALLSGEVSAVMLDMVTLKPQVEAGKIRLIAVTGKERSPQTPDVPTLAEQGYPGFEIYTWAGLFVPTGTPAPIVQKLHDSVKSFINKPDVVSRFADLGYLPGGASQTDFEKEVWSDQERWGELIRKVGIRLD